VVDYLVESEVRSRIWQWGAIQNQYIAMLHSSIGIGIGYWYRQRPILLDIGYWVPCLVSF